MFSIALLLALRFQADDLAERIRALDARVLPAELPRMIAKDARSRIDLANQQESKAWSEIRTRADWERHRDAKIRALRESLGADEPFPPELKVWVTRTLEGQGHRVENLLYQSKKGLLVSANLYVPVPEPPSMPGILIVHSHHNPKTQGELQDMGVTWARLGCLVLIPDQLGHGERRQHPFVDASSYPGSFKPGRQDYYFRFNVALQLQLIGESLIGWMAADLMKGVDVLLGRPGIDKNRIILLGSVAGGGDPAAVAAALDPRISAVVPFNFGGPQPETTYPLPESAETSFNYAGSGSWESTRNLRLSARDGFLPWVIVGSVAPRRLIYGHEFAWDRDHDPVWKRLGTIYGFYDAGGNLAAANGRGSVKGQPPESTHCNNIGPVHRQGIYPAFKRWFGIPEPEKESQERRPAVDLSCTRPDFQPRTVCDLALERARPEPGVPPDWERLLGDTRPVGEPRVEPVESRQVGNVQVERLPLDVEPGIVVPMVLLLPPRAADQKLPAAVGFAQGGKQEFLKQRSGDIAALLKGGIAVCLPDLRGTGETRPGDGRGRGSESTSIAATELMLGRTLLGLRIRDLRSVLRYLRSRTELDPKRLALWGDSFAPVNAPDRRVEVPLDADGQPELAEPLGGLLALFAGFLEKDVPAVYARGGLASYGSILHSPFIAVPYDIILPGVLRTGDLHQVASAIAPRAIRLEELVNGLNRPDGLRERHFQPRQLGKGGPSSWLLEQLKN
jgi:cephalosporin-C deacetylase-like acetyl esterase